MNTAKKRSAKTVAAVALAGLMTWGSFAAEPNGEAAKPPKLSKLPTITDKTLVVWVRLANTTQRAGSALTLIDDRERFDAVVFAEKEPGKWMAGSDFFRRTSRDQTACPVETADSKTPVQMAIVYDGNTITIYRNGKQYDGYQFDRPQPFDKDVIVLLGLRYVGGMGEVGFLAGDVEEARIYNVALDAETIARLKPNKPSDPKPIAQWTFEDGTASDSMKTFPPGELRGNARIADGKLLLDGKDSYVEIRRPRPVVVQSMFYRPRARETGRMWDTWLYWHEGIYYLYYLAKSGGRWDNISMATSPDGVHWKELGRVLSKRKDTTWMGTGSTWKSPRYDKDGKFFMNFSEWRGPRQTIFFAESTDLLHWRRLGDECEFQQDTRWYQPKGRWDCIYTIPRPGGGLFGYWTATPKPETGGRFGFGRTLDGVKWEALKPPETPGVGGGEAGAVEKIGEKYYMMFGHHPIMETLIADRPQGPFHPAKKNRLLLSGHTYFSRFFPAPDGVLVNHHAIARSGPVHFGSLKSTVLDDEGTLRLGWWKGNEKMKGQAVDVKVLPAAPSGNMPMAMIKDPLNTDKGVILEGMLALPKTEGSLRSGLYVECAKDSGSAILVASDGTVELGPVNVDGTGFKAEKRVDREMSFGKPAAFRLLLKGSLLEFYLDDILIECFSLPGDATGRVGFIGDVTGVKAWNCD